MIILNLTEREAEFLSVAFESMIIHPAVINAVYDFDEIYPVWPFEVVETIDIADSIAKKCKALTA